MFETLQVAVEGRIGTLTLNRPERLNALSIKTLDEIARAARWFDEQEAVRAVIVSGAGRAFSAGADLQGFPRPGDDGLRGGQLDSRGARGQRRHVHARLPSGSRRVSRRRPPFVVRPETHHAPGRGPRRLPRFEFLPDDLPVADRLGPGLSVGQAY